MFDPNAALQHLRNEWSVIRKAPIALVALGALAFGAGWWINDLRYQDRVESLTAANELLQARAGNPSEASAGPRLTESRKDVIRARLRDLAPGALSIYYGNTQSEGYARDLEAVFSKLGWTVEISPGVPLNASGLSVFPDNTRGRELAAAMQGATGYVVHASNGMLPFPDDKAPEDAPPFLQVRIEAD